MLLVTTFATAQEAAKVDVRGFGFFGNREMEQTLTLLLDDGTKLMTIDAGFIEDASLVLNSELVEEGFFAAAVLATWTTVDGRSGGARLDTSLSESLPRPLEVQRLRLEADTGARAVVDEVIIEGLEEIDVDAARTFFRPDAGLYTPDAARAWSPAKMRRAAERLRDALRARGLEQATVEVVPTEPDPKTGDVRVTVRVNQGPLWRVTGWRAEIVGGGELPGGEPEGLVGDVWTRTRALDLAQDVRRLYFYRGYAEVSVRWRAELVNTSFSTSAAGESAGEQAVIAVAEIEPGPAWTIGAVRFDGAQKTRAATMESRVRKLEPGAPYDPTEIDAARLRLARLGVFRRVEMTGEGAPTGGERDVVFQLAEEARWQASWLIGYGSYEQVRGAVELSRTNLRGRAHRDRVEIGQSLKASSGEYRYTVPTLFNDTVEGSARLFGLRREEPSFTRLEYGAGLEALRDLPWIDARGSAGISYQVLRADDVELGANSGELDNTAVAAVNLGLSRDVRDNPIRPRSGHRWSIQSETALPELGGDVRYERLELAWTWHRLLGGVAAERWLHVGASHGFVVGGGDTVPVNKLFFPGGESSNRGYTEGEATQRAADGRYIGVRATWLVNVELEQLITGRWTLVLFSDTLGTARNFEDWPGDEVLTALGLGLRYQSLIGPLRLEYGRNLNPRADDPLGTLHFSIGFPF